MQPDPAPGVLTAPEERQELASRESSVLCPSPFSLPLIRATQRLAEAQGAKWFALYVKIPYQRVSLGGKGIRLLVPYRKINRKDCRKPSPEVEARYQHRWKNRADFRLTG